ncbi:class V chitinase-like protein [Hypomontagnella monticulosa]|nr:class V chitinase-like protein [Hypomontagnella monticulosa]
MYSVLILLAAIGFGPPPASASWGRTLASIFRRSDCKTTTVESGDSCGSLATKCGISGSDLQKYNPDPKLCSTLQPGQRVCCSEGTLPDIRPKPLPNGTCASYVVKPDESCSSIAVKNGLKESDIDKFNKVTTWGFNSCSRGLQLGLRICLSSGVPPMPASMKGSVCGPTVPGSKPPIIGSKDGLAGLNPCPLNACCNIWGQCGTTNDFCIPTKGDFGNPGVGPPGSNGCVHNCGTDVVNNQNGPPHPISVGYYESWNMDRPCMHMTAKSLGGRGYTHIHWAFADVYQDLSVGINDTYKQFDDFVALGSGTKRIISFGGWGVSTSPATYDLLRRATAPDKREAFTDAVVSFVKKYELDGVDIDWEYPGAPDVPGIPPGLESDGPNYLETLRILRDKLPGSKSLSIAAPASYWYLKAFPIANMAQIVDYIVYMTYDLHGQWDYGNKWADDGCPAGNCLRSHVTKANAPSYKIAVGISSYGRSFKMTDPNCSGPMCGYVGPDSAAKPGMCTGTAGYISNAEINRIIRNGGNIQSWFDAKTMTDYLMYEGTEWVAYMSERTKAARMARWTELNFAGTVDWAIDLQEFDEDSEQALGVSPPSYQDHNTTTLAVLFFNSRLGATVTNNDTNSG